MIPLILHQGLFIWGNPYSSLTAIRNFAYKKFLAVNFIDLYKVPRMIVNENNSMPYMKSLVSCLNHMAHEGYTEDFKITPTGLEGLQKHMMYQPDQVRIVNFFRFEGESNPDDNAILYLIETNDGAKGTLVDAYGIYNDASVSRFLSEVKQIEKKIVKN